MRVQFITKQGIAQIREVPVGTEPERYRFGILIGPPDLSDLDLSKEKIKELNEALVENGFGDYRDTQGRRGELMTVIAKVLGTRDKGLLRQLLYLYQRELLEE